VAGVRCSRWHITKGEAKSNFEIALSWNSAGKQGATTSSTSVGAQFLAIV
jgi:hypothetical protein